MMMYKFNSSYKSDYLFKRFYNYYIFIIFRVIYMKRYSFKNIVLLVLFIVVLFVMWLFLSARQELDYFISNKTNGVITSDGYLDKEVEYLTKTTYYKYSVEYTVDNEVYKSKNFKTPSSSLFFGDNIKVYYNKSKPKYVVNFKIPVHGISTLFAIIYGILYFIKEKKYEE